MYKKKTLTALALMVSLQCMTMPTSEAIVDPCHFNNEKPAYCAERNKKVDWASMIAGFALERSIPKEQREALQKARSMNATLHAINILLHKPSMEDFEEMHRRGFDVMYMNGSSNANGTQGALFSSSDSYGTSTSNSSSTSNSNSSRSVSQGTNVTPQKKEEHSVNTLGEDGKKETSVKSDELQSATATISDAVEMGICQTPESLSEASECLINVSNTVGGLGKDQRTIFFAAAADDPEAKAYVAATMPEVYERYHDQEDALDIDAIIQSQKKFQEMRDNVLKKYGEWEVFLGDAKEALGALHEVRGQLANNGLNEETIDSVVHYLDKKEDLLKSAKKVDTKYLEPIKAEIDATIEGNKTLKGIRDRREKAEAKISSAGQKLQDKANTLEQKTGATFVSSAIRALGTDLRNLGEGDLITKAETITKWEREAAALMELKYSPQNQPKAEIKNAAQQTSSQTKANTWQEKAKEIGINVVKGLGVVAMLAGAAKLGGNVATQVVQKFK